MTERQSLGPVQVITSTPIEINRALQELVERIDALKGLRGAVVIHDRVRVANPTSATDAVNRQSITTISSVADETITGLKTFNRGAATPFAVVSGSPVVEHLNADLLDGEHASVFVHLTGAETLTGIKTFSAALRWVDTTNTLLHAFGTIT